MANEQNLKPIKKGDLSSEELKKRQRNGGKKSVAVRKEKKLFKEVVERQLGTTIEEVVKSMINQAKDYGNVQAATWLRDTVDGKPKQEIEGDFNLTKLEDVL